MKLASCIITMRLKSIKDLRLMAIMVLLTLFINIMTASGAMMAQIKSSTSTTGGQIQAHPMNLQQHKMPTFQHKLKQQTTNQPNSQQQQQQQEQQHKHVQHAAGQESRLPVEHLPSMVKILRHEPTTTLDQYQPHRQMNTMEAPSSYGTSKNAVTNDLLTQFQPDDDDDDIINPYIWSDLKRDIAFTPISTAATPLSKQTKAQSTMETPTSSVLYPWNLYQNHYANQPLSHLPPPSVALSAMQMFSQIFGSATATGHTPSPRLIPFMAYTQPMYIQYPFYLPSMSSGLMQNAHGNEMYSRDGAATTRHSIAGDNLNEERRPLYVNNNNSPIYYVRIPPTPYMLMSSLGSMWPYQTTAYSSLPSFSPIFNVPVNFLANGKPNNIYQMGGSPKDIQANLQLSRFNGFRPTMATHSTFQETMTPISAIQSDGQRPNLRSTSNLSHFYPNYPNAISSIHGHNPHQQQQQQQPQQQQQQHHVSFTETSSIASLATFPTKESKLTALKQPYYFNGRPDDIFVLPDNLKAVYNADHNSYY